MQVTILTEKDLRQHISINSAIIEAIADGFAKLSQGKVTMPPIMRLDIKDHNGEVDVKTAYIQGLDSFAIKMSPGFFDNYKLGLPSLSGLMVLLSAETGFVKAVLLDNGYLTDVRTGAAGAVAAKYLAPETIETAGVIGAGGQARYQMLALKQVRDFKRLLVYNRTEERAMKYVEEMSSLLSRVDIILGNSAEEVVRQSDLVVTTTPATDGFLKADWLHEGLHITAMGSDAEHKNELDSGVMAQADVIACDSKAQVFRLGELHHAKKAGTVDESQVIELGDVITGAKIGRTDDKQITICDLTGTGMQDTVIATMAYQLASDAGLGTVIEN